MTTTRDPLAVLRTVADHVDWPAMNVVTHLDWEEMHEAIAQVEALVAAAKQARRVLAWHTEYYRGGGNRVDARALADLEALIEAFTPGQDSEGGGHG